MSNAETIYALTEEAKDFFLPELANQFFKIVDARTKGRFYIRAISIHEDGTVTWLDAREFEVYPYEIKEVK